MTTFQPTMYPSAATGNVPPVAQPKVDFRKADELYTTIGLTQDVLTKTQAKIAELQATLGKETGLEPASFTASRITPPVYGNYVPDLENKSYNTLLREMADEAKVRNQSARGDVRAIIQLQEELRKEREITTYLNTLKEQVKAKAQTEQTVQNGENAGESFVDTAARIIGIAAALSVLPSSGVFSSILAGVLTTKLVKIIAAVAQDADRQLSSSLSTDASNRQPQYRFVSSYSY